MNNDLKNSSKYIFVLDGWRGIAILAVLGAHLFPLGPKWMDLNSCAGIIGMALFFILSGFLITGNLIDRPNIVEFIIRRFSRIIPLAWLYIIVALTFTTVSLKEYIAHFLFYGNLPPFWLTDVTGHLWSLCLEMQFYIFIAVLFYIMKEKGLKLIIPICIAVTIGRVITGTEVSIVTYLRVDEILAGSILALIYKGKLGENSKKILEKSNIYIFIILLLLSSHPYFKILNYLRPYFALIVIGKTLLQEDKEEIIIKILKNKYLKYIATVSYALYIIHPLLNHTWLGEGEKIVKYMKRPILLAVLFGLSHISTFYYEKFWIENSKKLIKKFNKKEKQNYIGEKNE